MRDQEAIDALTLRIIKMLEDFNTINTTLDNLDLSDGDCLDKIFDICKKYKE